MYGFLKKLASKQGMRRKYIAILTILCVIIFYFFSLPTPLFHEPYSTVLESRDNQLLGAGIADDGQWRFPEADSVPEKFGKCILYYEDQYFYQHIGFNPFSLVRATYQNLKAWKIVSGGSTITMQVIRLSRRKKRTFFEKFIEIILATRLEIKYSKQKILSIYSAHAPFGGNVVGLEAASWRYYGRDPNMLSWAESAALAVLPNSPSLVYPGKNHETLRKKRDGLLKKLFVNSEIDSLTYYLSLAEELPGTPHPIPQIASHLLQRALSEGWEGKKIPSSIDYNLQRKTEEIVGKHDEENKYNQIYNGAAIIVRIKTGEVLSYVGNTRDAQNRHDNYVDIIPSPRSTGSILKPFLYTALLDEGFITPNQIIPDIPTFFEGFAPKNYSLGYDGAVPANEALARSLNVPAVYMLRKYSYEKFHFLLNEIGLTTIARPPDDYGLSLILGGAEANLWDLTSAYASLARTLIHFNQFTEPNRYDKNDFRPNTYFKQNSLEINIRKGKNKSSYLGAPAIWFAFQAMLDVNRPVEESSWRLFDSSRKVAWKTGTSYGFRDGWAIGVTPEYVVGVWVGNADGEGRPGLTGLYEAAPVLFDIFNILPATGWFGRPFTGIVQARICKNSGYKAGINCPEVVDKLIPESSLRTTACPYCRLIHLDKTKKFQVNDNCVSVNEMVHKKWFVLPPVQEWYYQKVNPLYHKLPPFKKECRSATNRSVMEFIYPKNNTRVYIPVQLDGTQGSVVFEAAHTSNHSTIHWHLDDHYIDSTRDKHKLVLSPEPGEHVLTLVDDDGNTIQCRFKVINQE